MFPLSNEGLAPMSSVCSSSWNCVIGELGVVNQNGQPYPSTGFTSVYVMAHEIGHKYVTLRSPCPALLRLRKKEMMIFLQPFPSVAFTVWECLTTAPETPVPKKVTNAPNTVDFGSVHQLGGVFWFSSTHGNSGFIMSPSRGMVGETQWSSCSAKYLRTAK